MNTRKVIVLALIGCFPAAVLAQDTEAAPDFSPPTLTQGEPSLAEQAPRPQGAEVTPIEDMAPKPVTRLRRPAMPPPGMADSPSSDPSSSAAIALPSVPNAPPVTQSQAAATRNEVSLSNQGIVTWRNAANGVTVEWYPDGRLRRLYSRYSHPVEFPDRRGLNTAYVISEEKAKAGILRFLEQSAYSERYINEVQSDFSQAAQKRESGLKPIVNKTDERKFAQSLREVTGSKVSGTLRGITVLERGFDENAEEAWVMVGFSDRTIQAARAVRQMIDGQLVSGSPVSPAMGGTMNQPANPVRSPDGMTPMGHEIKSSISQDW